MDSPMGKTLCKTIVRMNGTLEKHGRKCHIGDT